MKALLTLSLLGLGLGLAGCAALDIDSAFTNPDCRKVMYDDPLVKRAMGDVAFAGTAVIGNAGANDLTLVKRRAYNACLRQRGLQHGGGVQQVQPAS